MDKLILKKYKIYIIIVLILVVTITGCSSGLSSPSDSSSTNYIVSGSITDYNTQQPIKGANIILGNNTTKTDSNGFYKLTNIETASYTISVLADNYYSYQENIEISANHTWNKAIFPYQAGGLITGNVKIINSSQDYTEQISLSSNSQDNNISTKSTQDYKENEIVVKYRNSQEPITIQNDKNYIKLSSSKNPTNKGIIINYKLPNDTNMEDILNEYNSLPDVEWAEPNYIYHITSIPNDPYYPQQWGNHRTNLEGARDYFTSSNVNPVTVAVIDTGIIPDHPDLKDRISPLGADFVGDPTDGLDYNMTDDDPSDESRSTTLSHGSHVAGIIGATTDNSEGIASVYNNVEILPIRVINRFGNGDTIDLIEGIEYAIKMDVDIINMSLAGSGNSSALRETIKEAVNQGIIVVAAAGNSGYSSVLYPAAFPEVIAVGSINQNNKISYFSNYGSKLDLVAPGEDIISTSGYMINDGSIFSDYYYMSGTSMSTPYVSGIATLLIASGQTDIRNILQDTAVDLGDEGMDIKYGHGLVDAYAALRGKSLSLPDVYVATIEESQINTLTPPGIWDNGSYIIPNAPPGDYYLVVIRDLNDNGIIDTGDYFGKSTNTIYIEEQTTTSKNTKLYYVDDNSPYHGWKFYK